MRIPPNLKPCDTIGLTCSARKISSKELQPAIKILESWGFKVQLGQTIGLSDNQFAGTDKERADDFQQLMDDENVSAILVCRGGYGTVRIMDHLDYTKFMQHPKWIIGYSDATILHSHLNTVMGIASLHATMPVNFETNTSEALHSLKDVLNGDSLKYEIKPHQFNRTGIANAEVVGGNLSLVYSLLGTKTGINTTHRILFLEDLDEYLYHIDRMMVSLKRAGKLDHLAGLIIGGMSDMNDNTIPFGKTAQEIIQEHVAEFDYPVCFGFPAGHINDNRAIIFGKKAHLMVTDKKVSFKQ